MPETARPAPTVGEVGPAGFEVPERVLLAGFGQANQAMAGALCARGHTVSAFDDSPSSQATAAASALGIDLVAAPSTRRLAILVGDAEMMIPTPGLPDSHQAFRLAADTRIPLGGELDLAQLWDSRPVAAITGTNGKTTVTETVTAALRASGVNAVAAGNNDLPWISAIDRHDVETFVVEASSFRLAHTKVFAPSVGCWLNFAPDHLDVHNNMEAYEAAKARLWARSGPTTVAVANADDPTVMRHVPTGGAVVWTFSQRRQATWCCRGSGPRREIVGPHGPLMKLHDLPRNLPHDVDNALAAAATALAAGASPDGVREALAVHEPAAHRLKRVAVIDGVEFYDDSKATTPHATRAALAGFASVVLIAGGRNKDLDLSVLGRHAERVCAVVAIGEAAPEVAAAFAGRCRVLNAESMQQAVELAADAARSAASHGAAPVVLLSPACASFDAYSSYAQRGDDFIRIVNSLRAPNRPKAQPVGLEGS